MAKSERQGIADLAEQVGWLSGIRWYLSQEAALRVDFDIEHQGNKFPLTMTYAALHPNAPPIVVPRDGARLSSHQYGAGGELCLEFRSDNWVTSVSGAMMVESAYRLIVGERGGAAGEVPSAHHLSIGQSVRGSHFRFLETDAICHRLHDIEPAHYIEIGIDGKLHAGVLTYTVTSIDGVSVAGAWHSTEKASAQKGYGVHLPSAMEVPLRTIESLSAALDDLGLHVVGEQIAAAGADVHLVLMTDGALLHFCAFDSAEGDRQVFGSRTLKVPDTSGRLPVEYAVLSERRVGIVGCGSLGSKVAVSLMRSGVRHFTLVDDDILFPANLIRNELAQPAIGVHKVDALKERLIEIGRDIKVRTRRVALGGQESADSTNSVMSDLQACDVIVDATADPRCFNFCAAVARAGSKPMVWGEVFGGGIGGLVVRVRPGREPDPQTARNQLTAWCESHGIAAPMAHEEVPYASISEGAPLIADDAEVSIVAGHITRLVTDVLVFPEESIFPAPAYALGLRKAWIFSQPFETWPINLVGVEPWSVAPDDASVEEALALLRELIALPQ